MIFLKKYQVYFISVILMVLISCGKDSTCFKGTGDKVQEHRAIVVDVSRIIAEDNINIVITQSDEPVMIVEGGENLLPYIKTDVSGTVLSISSDNKCGMFRDNTIPITVYLSIPNLVNIDYAGQGNISSTNTLILPFLNIDSRTGTGSFNLNLNVEELAIKQHSGPADFRIAGNVNSLYVYTLGSGWFYLDKLVSNIVHVNHSGIGDVFVNATNKLSVEMRSRGSVYYLGNPEVRVSPEGGEGSVNSQ